jgi:integrase
VPKHAVEAYGSFIRQSLSQCLEEAAEYAFRLNTVLESSWKSRVRGTAVDVATIIESFKPRASLLSEMAEEYLSLRQVDQTPPRVALNIFISIAGDRDVGEYSREDAKLFVRHLTTRGNKTATIRRRINCLSAILNYAYAELDLDKRNPFTRLIIRNEGDDVFKRGTFTNEQLKRGYDKAINSGSQVRLLMPLLGETGCRLAEIVGLELNDIDMDQELVHVRPNSIRRLKTRNSERTLPLVGYAKIAKELAISKSDGKYLFPRYVRNGNCNADHTSAALNKWLKKDFDGLTAHCLRHTIRDRLRAVECPLELIDQIGGWRSVSSIGAGNGKGYSLDAVKHQRHRCQI